ncbi:MAG: hypothetical protein OCD02_12595 [Spirochaetaceae bacterium]
MKYLILFVFLFISISLYSEVSMISGFLNDNYTGSTENGINGDYIGADDFLTFSLFANTKKDNFGISQYFHVITSRKFNYRYDLLLTSVYYDLDVRPFNVTPTFSLLYKGEFGGEDIQNGIHDFRGIPALEQEYEDEELSPVFGFDAFYEYSIFRGRLNVDAPLSIKPISTRLTLEYILDLKYVSFDFASGYKHYFTDVDGYSDFVRSGMIFGGQSIFQIYKGFTLNAGCFFFPVKNLDSDPVYLDRDFLYSPQFWVTIGLNGDIFRIMDIVRF